MRTYIEGQEYRWEDFTGHLKERNVFTVREVSKDGQSVRMVEVAAAGGVLFRLTPRKADKLETVVSGHVSEFSPVVPSFLKRLGDDES